MFYAKILFSRCYQVGSILSCLSYAHKPLKKGERMKCLITVVFGLTALPLMSYAQNAPSPPHRDTALVATKTEPEPPGSPSLIPLLKADPFTLKLEGWTQVYYMPEDGVTPQVEKVRLGSDDLQWTSIRLRSTLTTGTPLSFFTDFEMMDLDDGSKNWMRNAEVRWKFNDDWQIKAGRIALSPIWLTPPPFLLETIRYPRVPFPVFGYGVQVEGNLGDGWKLWADVSGASGVSFDDRENWDHMEFSSRLQKDLTKELFVGGTVQLGEEFSRFALDFGYKPTDQLCLKGAIYTLNEEQANIQGAYAFAGYKVLKWAELHTMMDYQNSKPNGMPGEDSFIWTNGVRLWAPNDQVSFTVDHEWIVNGEQESRVMARLQFRF